MAHLVFAYLRRQRVASQTPREGLCQAPQIKTPDYFLELLPWLGCPQVISVRYPAAFKKTHIAGQQNPAFVARDLRQSLVGATVARNNKSYRYLLRALVSCGACQSACIARTTMGESGITSAAAKASHLFAA
jgi:hypothetical protein